MTSTVATTKGFDALLVVHALLAITAFVVLLVLRAAASEAARGGELTASARRSFTGRTELAGRVVHLVPLTGLGLLALSRGAYSLATGFVVVGLLAWLLAAGCLEAIAFPAQRAVAAAVVANGDASGDARRMALGIDVAALAVVGAAIAMVLGTAF
ncbi:MAG TPA: hypothetical protein VGZ33_06760 [Acidimicrobiales bacterium]|nr:hypothetical protein [Acidimicrobiales bacterium]